MYCHFVLICVFNTYSGVLDLKKIKLHVHTNFRTKHTYMYCIMLHRYPKMYMPSMGYRISVDPYCYCTNDYIYERIIFSGVHLVKVDTNLKLHCTTFGTHIYKVRYQTIRNIQIVSLPKDTKCWLIFFLI